MTEERDPKVSGRYRALPGEEPPPALDQAILAAARRATDRPHAPLVFPAGRHRWYYSLAAAAILVLAVAVTLHVEQQQPDAELAVPLPPAPLPAPQIEQPAMQPPPAPAPAPERERLARQERRQAYPPAPPTQPAAEPRAGAAQDAVAPRAEAAAEQAQAAAKAAELRSDRAATAATPERELERIVELRRQGRDEEADKALAEFRKRYPDYQISAEMRFKVERGPAR